VNDEQKLELRVDISIRDYRGGGTLQVSETVTVPAGTFLELAGILAQFHEVTERLKAAKNDVVSPAKDTVSPAN